MRVHVDVGGHWNVRCYRHDMVKRGSAWFGACRERMDDGVDEVRRILEHVDTCGVVGTMYHDRVEYRPCMGSLGTK